MYKVKKKSGEGRASSFYILTCGTKGFKEFDSKLKADIAYDNQVDLSEHDLAPNVYSEVGKIRKKGKKLSGWGYITEIAELLCCPGNECDCCDRDALESHYYDEIKSLQNDMLDINMELYDSHIGNVGYVIRNGLPVMVCIDMYDSFAFRPHGR